MAKRYNSKHNKKVRNLVAICALCAIVLTVSTYAWFIGMRTVSVNSFDIEIASTEGLFLSMDGINWTYNLDAKGAKAYDGNTNQWLDGEKEGLIPMSSVGDMDSNSSRMILFEKASLTASDKFSGMRLLSSQVQNGKDSEGNLMKGKGYVAFDLFIKNMSGEKYYAENNPLNEEAIYLRDNSSVKVSGTGAGVENTGIENSVRVGFAQIGRVIATNENQATITGITCANSGTDADQVTGICRSAQIWEPNDTKHVANAISWYKTSCKKRTGESVVDSDSYSAEACPEITDNTYYPTYAVANVLDIKDNTHSNVNIYDGKEFNGYEANTMSYKDYQAMTEKSTAKLVSYDYFKDSDKIKNGVERPTFMTLAPNSITKVRVYIWLEGQDIDNYDFAQLGQQISVNFGFTKERFEQNEDNSADIPGYNGPAIPETTNDPAKPVPTNEPTPTPGD